MFSATVCDPTLSIGYIYTITLKIHLKQKEPIWPLWRAFFWTLYSKISRAVLKFQLNQFSVTRLCNRFCFHYKRCDKKSMGRCESLGQHQDESIRQQPEIIAGYRRPSERSSTYSACWGSINAVWIILSNVYLTFSYKVPTAVGEDVN